MQAIINYYIALAITKVLMINNYVIIIGVMALNIIIIMVTILAIYIINYLNSFPLKNINLSMHSKIIK